MTYPEDDDMHLYIDTELGELRLEYGPGENAWLIAEDHGDLREACVRVARLAVPIVDQLRESLFFDPPATSFDSAASAGRGELPQAGPGWRLESITTERFWTVAGATTRRQAWLRR